MSGTSFVALETQKTFGGTWSNWPNTPASAPTAICTRSATASSRGPAPIATAAEIPQISGRRDRGERPRQAHPLPAPHHLGEMVGQGHPGPSTLPEAIPARRCASPPISSGCARAITATPKATRMEGHGQIQGPDRPSAEMARRPRLQHKRVVVIGSAPPRRR